MESPTRKQPAAPVRQDLEVAQRHTAQVFEFPRKEVPPHLKRTLRVAPIAAACDAPVLKARKQREKRIAGMPGVVEIEYASGAKVWFYRFRDPRSGKRNSIRLGRVGSMTLMELAAKAQALRTCVGDGRSPFADRTLLDEFFEKNYKPWARQNKRSAKVDFGRYANHIAATLGHMPIGDIRRKDVDRLIRRLRSGELVGANGGALSDATTNRDYQLLRSVFRLAVEEEFIPANPAAGIRMARETPPEPRALSDEEIARFIAALEGEPALYVALVFVLLGCALRINEALHLRASDVDFVGKVLHLRTTKAGVAQTVPLSPLVEETIKTLVASRENEESFLFPASRGDGPMAPPYAWLKRVFAKAGVEYGGFHLFRKTAGTSMAYLTTPLAASQVLRHAALTTFERHYLAKKPAKLQAAVAALGDALSRAQQRGGERFDSAPPACVTSD